MKAVIVDLNGNDAVALRDDGRFEKIKNKNFSIGQEITMQTQVIRFPKQAAIAASAAIVVAFGGMGTYTWSNPISYVSLDINPSINYALNEFNRVITVSGMNDEGIAIVDAIGDSLKNTDITTALSITVEQLSTDAYLDSENTNYMVIGVYSDKDSKADALMSTVDEFTANSVETCSITTVNVSKETKETADSYGITGGKMELINEIANVATDPKEIDPAALADLTVAELEQTKTVAASGASVTEAVAAVTPDAKEPVSTEDTIPDTFASDEGASESKTADDDTSSSSVSKEDASAEKPVEDASPVVAAADQPTAVDDPAATDSKANNSVSNSTAGSANKNENSSSDKKDEPVVSPAKNETTSPENKDETASSDKKDDASSDKKNNSTTDKKNDGSSDKKDGGSSDKKDHAASDKKDNASSDKKEEVEEDSSQQTNSDFDPEIPDGFEIEHPVSGDELLVCSMAV